MTYEETHEEIITVNGNRFCLTILKEDDSDELSASEFVIDALGWPHLINTVATFYTLQDALNWMMTFDPKDLEIITKEEMEQCLKGTPEYPELDCLNLD